MKKRIFIPLICSLLTTTLLAKADMKLVDEYLEVSGAKEIILALPEQIERGYLTSIQDEELKNIDIKGSFDSPSAIIYVKEKLSQEFSDGLLKNIITYYKSPLGVKYKSNGINAMRDIDNKQRIDFFSEVKKNPPTYNRLNVMNAFVDRLELTPVAVHLIGELLGSINAKLVTTENSDKILRDISDQIRESMLINSLYAYSDFSDKELKSVMEYYYTNAGRFEQIIVSGVFKQLIMESFAQIMEQRELRTANLNQTK